VLLAGGAQLFNRSERPAWLRPSSLNLCRASFLEHRSVHHETAVLSAAALFEFKIYILQIKFLVSDTLSPLRLSNEDFNLLDELK